MDRFLVFAGDAFYPAGGWGDFAGSAATKEAAEALLPAIRGDWLQIVDQDADEVTEYRWANGQWMSKEAADAWEAEAAAKAKVRFNATHVKLPTGQPFCGDCKIGFDGPSWCSCGKYEKAGAQTPA